MIAYDCETHLIRPGLAAPPMVCMSFSDGEAHGLEHAMDLTEEAVRFYLFEHGGLIVGANLAFDMGVVAARFPRLVPDIFRAYDEGRCRDVQIDQRLIDIAHGCLGGYTTHEGRRVEFRYSLADLELRILGRDRHAEKGPDAWRYRYHELSNVPIEEWPEDAKDYAIADAEGAARVHLVQEEQSGDLLLDAPAQARAAWSLHLMSAWGLKTNEQNIRSFQAICEARFEEITRRLQAAGLVRADGSRNTKAAQARMVEACKARGVEPALTASGAVSLTADACEDSGDELLEEYAERTSLLTVVKTHIPALYRGVDSVIQPRFNVLVETGRTSCSGADSGRNRPSHWCGKQDPPRDCIPRSEEDRFCVFCEEMLPASYGYQTQNVRRLPGLRECFEARPGTYYIDADFSGLELCTVAQTCIILVGYSRLGEAINAGLDAHLDLAAQILRIPYEDARARRLQGDKEVANVRNAAKVANFGFPGGLGIEGFVKFARSAYGVRITITEAEELKTNWLRKWPEFNDYFAFIRELCEPLGVAHVEQLFTGRQRGLVPYTAACNGFFQGLGADVAKRALYAVTRACYAEPESVLYGSRPVNFIHDQIITETPIATAHEAAFEQARIMVEAGNLYLPDVPVSCTPALSTIWTKDAEAVFDGRPDEGGRLVPWDLAHRERWKVYNTEGELIRWK